MSDGRAASVNREPKGWLRLVPGLATFGSYEKAWLAPDILAGVSVAAVAIPVGMAYAQLMGLPPVTGLYATIIPLVVYFFFGSSRQLIVGPDASTAALVAAALASVAVADPASYVPLACMLAVLAGVFAVLGGILRLGFVANFLGKPILVGFMNGTALIIIMSQAGKFFGFSLQSSGFFRQVVELVSRLGQTHLLTLGVGVLTFALVRYLPRVAPKWPTPLIAVVVGIILAVGFRLEERGVAVLGAIPSGLPLPRLPSLEGIPLFTLVADALGIALISYTGTIVNARAYAAKNRYDIDANQEMIAVGASNLVTSLFQGYAVAGTASRTAVNDSVGGKSRAVGIIAAVCVTAALLFLTGPIAYLPSAALAAIIINAGLGILDLRSMGWLRKVRKPEFRLAIIAWIGVLTIGVLKGVLLAVVLAIVELLRHVSHPRDAVLGYSRERGDFYDVARHEGLETQPGLLIYRFNAPIVFFNADCFRDRVRAVIEAAVDRVEWLLLDAEMIGGIDGTAAERIEDVREELASRGIVFAVARPSAQVREMLESTGFGERIGKEYMFANVKAGLDTFRARQSATQTGPVE